jgi:hypothetical protein
MSLFFLLFCYNGKMRGHIWRTRNCEQWNHPYRCGSPPSATSWTTMSWLYTFELVMLDTWTFVVWCDLVLISVVCRTLLHILVECEDDHFCVPNVMAFLHGIALAESIWLIVYVMLNAGFPLWRTGFSPRWLQVRLMVDKVVLEQVFIWVLQFSPANNSAIASYACFHPLRCAISLTK